MNKNKLLWKEQTGGKHQISVYIELCININLKNLENKKNYNMNNFQNCHPGESWRGEMC